MEKTMRQRMLAGELYIAAGSVVTRDIPAGVFAAGNPCRVIRELTVNERETRR